MGHNVAYKSFAFSGILPPVRDRMAIFCPISVLELDTRRASSARRGIFLHNQGIESVESSESVDFLVTATQTVGLKLNRKLQLRCFLLFKISPGRKIPLNI